MLGTFLQGSMPLCGHAKRVRATVTELAWLDGGVCIVNFTHMNCGLRGSALEITTVEQVA